MVLNIFPRKKESTEPGAGETPQQLPEPSPEALETLEDAPKRPTRRGSRGGRGRGAAAEPRDEGAEAEQPQPEVVPESPDDDGATPRRSRRSRSTSARAEAEPAEEAKASAPEPAEEDKAPRGRRGRGGSAAGEARREPEQAPPPQRPQREPARKEPTDAGSASILRAIDLQNQQIDRLIQLQEDMARRVGSGASVSAPPARVGVFVDAANVELASDRLRARFDWGKILKLLTENRQLVRAIAYSPVHDDPGVSMETQRFVEPFLDKGYKVVTKPLKRFQDGTIKANVDIELALDVITMLDRLDVVCLVSGDGDFQRLVEVVQTRGVRVEVIAVGASTAGNLRNAADKFIDLQTRLRDVRV
jgi:uncharacterized LabA/DUF88 family protein